MDSMYPMTRSCVNGATTLIILLNGVGDVSDVMKRNGHLICENIMYINEAINNSSKVHYNYNRLEIPENDLKTLIHEPANAPTKYDEEHYSVKSFYRPKSNL